MCSDSAIRDPATSKTLRQRFGGTIKNLSNKIEEIQGGCDIEHDDLVNFTTEKHIAAVTRIQQQNVQFAIHDL